MKTKGSVALFTSLEENKNKKGRKSLGFLLRSVYVSEYTIEVAAKFTPASKHNPFLFI